MVVGPGSLHPIGVRYNVIKDLPIASIRSDLLERVKNIFAKPQNNEAHLVTATKGSKKNKKKKKHKEKSKDHIDIRKYIKIEDIAMPANVVANNGTEIQGSHPVHGSETGKDFSINPEKNTWHCFRCGSGGGPLEWIAVEAGLISCVDAGPGCLRGELFKKVLEIARDKGYEIPDFKRSGNQVRIIDRRLMVDDLPEELPPDQLVIVKGSPRIGKTHWCVEHLKKAHSGIFISHTHSVVDHALHIFEKIGGQSALHLEGKNRPGMCRKNKTNCRECEFYPNQHDKDHISFIDLQMRAEELLRAEKILTKDKIPYDLCPYFTLKFAEEFADFVFSVPHFLEDLRPRRLLVLDEDPTLSYFYPPSPMIFKYKKIRMNLDPIIF
jgi:hypothetical protein